MYDGFRLPRHIVSTLSAPNGLYSGLKTERSVLSHLFSTRDVQSLMDQPRAN